MLLIASARDGVGVRVGVRVGVTVIVKPNVAVGVSVAAETVLVVTRLAVGDGVCTVAGAISVVAMAVGAAVASTVLVVVGVISGVALGFGCAVAVFGTAVKVGGRVAGTGLFTSRFVVATGFVASTAAARSRAIRVATASAVCTAFGTAAVANGGGDGVRLGSAGAVGAGRRVGRSVAATVDAGRALAMAIAVGATGGADGGSAMRCCKKIAPLSASVATSNPVTSRGIVRERPTTCDVLGAIGCTWFTALGASPCTISMTRSRLSQPVCKSSA